MNIKIGLVSLGCPKNLVDSENMLGIIGENGFEITPQPEDADVIIVNTCGFIESAKEESIETVLQMAEYKDFNCKKLILAGCLGERYARELFEQLPEVDVIVGTNGWVDIIKIIKQAMNGDRFIHKPEKLLVDYKSLPRKLTTSNSTAYLKIAEGCDNACSYCIIPRIKGPYISRAFDVIVSEAKQLALSGVKELVLVAQDVTRYGEDLTGKLILPDLLTELSKIDGIKWLRIMYAYPEYVTDELLDVISANDKVCKYIDIPLQHISDNVLSAMNRRSTKKQIKELLQKMRQKVPNICIRTTFIVGFPGETGEDYQELKEFILKEQFDRVGVFAYSQEEDTLAATMVQIEDEIKQEHYHELMAIQAKISENINIALEDKQMSVLIENIDFTEDNQKVVSGRTYREAPEIDGIVYLENADDVKVGTFVQAKIIQGFTYDLLAQVI